MNNNSSLKYSQEFSDEDYIFGLKNSNCIIIHSFFYSLCNYMLNDIRWSLMQGRIDYDELVNELYLYLSANNWQKLDTFEHRNNCSLKSWLVKIIWRFFMLQKTRLVYNEQYLEYDVVDNIDATAKPLTIEISMDVESTFRRMTNQKYVRVLRWMLIDGYEANEVAEFLETSISNVYNTKHRAIVQFVKTFNS